MMQEFVSEIEKTAKMVTDDIHTALPGVIIAFDTDTGLASVQPKVKYKKPSGKTMDFPVVTGVPVHFPHSGFVTVAYPIKPGDNCIIIFSESAIDFWQYGQETDTELKFDLSNAMVIPGLSASSNEAMKKACEENAVVVQNRETTLAVTSKGIVVDGNIIINGSLTATGEVTSAGKKLSTHTHIGYSGTTTSTPN